MLQVTVLLITITSIVLDPLIFANSSLSIEGVLIQKPYEQVCDQDQFEDGPLEPQIDQTRPECPLPLNSSSRNTGCLCHFDSSRIECIYADRLAKLPQFISMTSKNETAHNWTSISWDIDLRCKNITHISGFEFVTNLTQLNEIDLSGLSNEKYFQHCKFADTNNANYSLQIRYIEQVFV